MKLLKIALVLSGAFLSGCFEKPNNPASLTEYRVLNGKIEYVKYSIFDTSIISTETTRDSMYRLADLPCFGFNDSLWHIDSNTIFVNSYITYKLALSIFEGENDITKILAFDSSIILFGKLFDYSIENAIVHFKWREKPSNGEVSFLGHTENDSLFIPFLIEELSYNTTFAFITSPTIDSVLSKRKRCHNRSKICSPTDTNCVSILVALPRGIMDTVIYKFGELRYPFHRN
jgi:hypothetical protein